ncbi:ABC transporter ATP-binding protein [Streptomyces sedi]|uniref:ABC transporter ATP-binding protein n=1 Tax=Streptomyces sedi TaxID=555059 RepID=A0A5C4V2Z4_9ACTN|nr:ATP-binding cassette domain-containing protein [Streptomyces sedi]TNM30251.1 ABC transporter ATP-binding protein [Streptomyces sedi]
METELLRLAGVRHGYGERPVLGDVSLALCAGEAVAVLGANGAGKSTLLRIAAGREEPDAGTATLRGRPADEDDAAFRADVACALAPGAHYPDLTVREHLLLVALAHRVPEAEDRVAEALAEHRLADHAEQFPAALSAGLGQLLSLAATRVRPHTLLILDEPEAHLDAEARAALALRLAATAAEGGAVLLATHDPALAERSGARRLELVDGRLRAAA